MFWIIALVLTVLGAIAHIALAGSGSWTTVGMAEIGLVWLTAGFYGAATLIAGLQHLLNADRVAAYIGWAPGSGFQLELGWAEVGIAVAGCLAIWFRGPYLLAPALAASVLYMGAGLVHARDMARHGNFSPGSAGPVFYIDLIVPLLTVVLLVLYAPWPS
jgi:hypothetical protein